MILLVLQVKLTLDWPKIKSLLKELLLKVLTGLKMLQVRQPLPLQQLKVLEMTLLGVTHLFKDFWKYLPFLLSQKSNDLPFGVSTYTQRLKKDKGTRVGH